MKTTAALLCSAALLAAACSDKTPAKDPSSDSSMTSTTTSAPNANNTGSTGAMPTDNAMGTGSSTDSSSTMGTSSSSTGSSMAGSSMTGTSATGNRGTGTSSGSGTSSAMNSAAPSTGTTPAAAPTPTPAAGAAVANADNTRRNERDRHGATLTAGDQGNSSSEVKITAAIRKQVVGSSMSFNAKNAKIITTGTKVTLRGPVKTDEEKAQIESMAKATPGVTEVDNQLEVKK